MPKEATQFKKGNPGGPGRPKGFKAKALDLINEVYKGREDEAREYLKTMPIEEFLEKFVLPFVPKSLALTSSDGERDLVQDFDTFMTKTREELERHIDSRIRETRRQNTGKSN